MADSPSTPGSGDPSELVRRLIFKGDPARQEFADLLVEQIEFMQGEWEKLNGETEALNEALNAAYRLHEALTKFDDYHDPEPDDHDEDWTPEQVPAAVEEVRR